jgi:hypothetical protein
MEPINYASQNRRAWQRYEPGKNDRIDDTRICFTGGQADPEKRSDRNVGCGDGQSPEAGEHNQNRGSQVGSESLPVIHRCDFLAHGLSHFSGIKQSAYRHGGCDSNKTPTDVERFP